MAILTKVLQYLPHDLFPILLSYIIRPDWRSCRAHEAKHITAFNRWTKRVLDDDALDWYYPGVHIQFPIMFCQKELDVYMNDWTLFGRWFLILLTREDTYWHLARDFTVQFTNNYRKWYKMEFLSYHNDHRRFH